MAQSAPAQVRSGSSPTGTLAVIKTIGVGAAPTGLAVNDADDTVYVANYTSGNVSVINGRTGTRTDDTIPVNPNANPRNIAVNQNDDTVYIASEGIFPYLLVANGRTGQLDDSIAITDRSGGVAVNQVDDTVYVSWRGGSGDGTWLTIIDGRSQTVDDTLTVAQGPYGLAVNDGDDSVYVANNGPSISPSNIVSIIDGLTVTVATTLTGPSDPLEVAVNQADDTVYVTNRASNNISVINGVTSALVSTIGVGSSPYGVAVDQTDDTVYVVNRGSNSISVINGRTGVRTDDTVTVGSSPVGVAVDGVGTNAGLVYVSNASSNSVSVIGRVTPTAVPASGYADDTFTMTLTVPNLSPSFSMADNTVTSVMFDGTPATATPGAGDTWTVTVPAGIIGSTVPVTVTFNGGLSTSLGTFTYSLPPACASSTFTSDDSCTVAPGETVSFTVVSGAGGAGGIGGTGYQCTPANGGFGGNGGQGGFGGPGLAVSGTYTNSTNASVTLDALVGANGAAGTPGIAGSHGPNGTLLAPTGGDGFDGTDGGNGQHGSPSAIAVSGGATLVSAGAGTGGARGTKGSGGTGGGASPNCTAGEMGASGTAGNPGFAGTLLVPGSLPTGWTTATGSGLPRVVFTAPTPPPPTPVYPPGAPTDVKAVAGDASAVVTWRAPADSGSFPITNYRVVAQPGGQSCLVSAPTLTCTVSGLTNGTAYTFTAEALNGAGWGPMSSASAPVIPSSTKVARITLDQGKRASDGRHDRITTGGTTEGIPVGTKLTPHIRYQGQREFTQGVATIVVSADGTFAWTRQVRSNRGLTAYVSWEDTKSNKVYWARLS